MLEPGMSPRGWRLMEQDKTPYHPLPAARPRVTGATTGIGRTAVLSLTALGAAS